jgi:hypothetical protein
MCRVAHHCRNAVAFVCLERSVSSPQAVFNLLKACLVKLSIPYALSVGFADHQRTPAAG